MSLSPKRYAVSTVTAATGTPVTLDQAKLALRVDTGDENAYIDGLLRAATAFVEARTHRALMPQTLRLTMDRFDYSCDADTSVEYLRIPRPPLASVSSITYVATDGTSTTWASSNYSVDTYSEPGRVSPIYGQTWPSARYQPNAVTIQFIAGSTAIGNVDEGYKTAIKMLVDHWYNHRSAVDEVEMMAVPMAVDALLGSLDYGGYTV